MRCTTARKMITTTPDRAAPAAERERLARHLATCEPCRLESVQIGRLAEALEGLGGEAAVPAGLEDAVLRRIRTLEPEGPGWGERVRAWLGAPVLAVGVVGAVLLVAFLARDPGTGPDAPGPLARVEPVPPAGDAPVRVASAPAGAAADPAETVPVGAEPRRPAPPPEMLAELPMLLDLPILRNMEKLEHFDSITALVADGERAPDDPEVNG